MEQQDFAAELKEIEEAQKALDARRAAVKAQVIARVQELVCKYGLTTADIRLPAPGEKIEPAKAPKIKYRDQNGNVWSGRGRKPNWLAKALEEGAQIEDFLVA